jgi:hypothetical protein
MEVYGVGARNPVNTIIETPPEIICIVKPGAHRKIVVILMWPCNILQDDDNDPRPAIEPP